MRAQIRTANRSFGANGLSDTVQIVGACNKVQTSNELQKVLDSPHSGIVFVEAVMDNYDAPIDLIAGGHALADSDYGVPGPRSAANAQIPLPTWWRNVDSPPDPD